jgi:hypothetical protein
MKTKLKSALGISLLGSLLLLGGCVLMSVYPYYTAKDVVFEPKLVGSWSDPEKSAATNEFWEFSREGTNNTYTLAVHDKGKVTKFDARLFRLKKWTFLDARPTEGDDNFIPPHCLLKVTQLEPALKMALLDYNWTRNLLATNPGALRHTIVDARPGEPDSGRIVFTADTAELQQFILKYAADTNAFPECITMTRKK